MSDKSQKDRAVAWILAAIWFGAIAIVIATRDDIPLHLLGIATLFFLMLVPSMKELVRNVERYFTGTQDGGGARDDQA